MKILLILLILLPACQKTRIEKEFNNLKNSAKDISGADITYDSYSKNPEMERSISNQLAQGISREQAVRTALMNNPYLQADFDRLGIAKADLVQAGLYTNPKTTNVFRFPTKGQGPGTTQLNIESELTGKLSDLWRVPLRTRIYEDELEIVTLRILTTILDVIEHTKSAYDACVKAELLLKNEKIILSFSQELRDEIYYRQGFGYSNEQNKYDADAQVAAAQAAVLTREREQLSAYLHLTELLGISPTTQDIVLTDTILASVLIPDIGSLELYALDYRPEIQVARYKVKRYEDTMRFERGNAWKDVDIGVTYKQDLDKPFRGWGPAVNFEIPIFDTNYAQIAKAEFELERAKKKMRSKTIRIQGEVRMAFVQVQQELQEIQRYNTVVIPSYEKAIDYAYTYAQTMQLNMLTALQSQLHLYRAEQELIEKYYNLHVSYNRLERAYGKVIEPKSEHMHIKTT